MQEDVYTSIILQRVIYVVLLSIEVMHQMHLIKWEKGFR
jgi:hypothetical protein